MLCRKHCRWTSLQYASVGLILCEKPLDGWHVRCWCRLRIVENAGEASPYVEIKVLNCTKDFTAIGLPFTRVIWHKQNYVIELERFWIQFLEALQIYIIFSLIQ